ncbi:MAG: coproporphyrinogen III oxidase [Micavibrio sp.]|nr:MAG: coproporphyrinogen III oxidase [Micavibrio sp.]
MSAWAQNTPPAVPPVPVEAEALKPKMNGLVVLELFSSQACVFCPKADRLLDDLSQMENVIGLACHVDYFGVQKGSLSRPFCSARQTRYKSTLRSGPNYTPQMVINGRYETIGYRLDDISEKMWEASDQKIGKIEIIKTEKKNQFDLRLPDNKEGVENSSYDIWLATTDKPHQRSIKGGQKIVYNNIVSAMSQLDTGDANKKGIRIAANLKDKHSGFVVFAQDPESGYIIAAGQYLKPHEKPPMFGPFRPAAKPL